MSSILARMGGQVQTFKHEILHDKIMLVRTANVVHDPQSGDERQKIFGFGQLPVLSRAFETRRDRASFAEM